MKNENKLREKIRQAYETEYLENEDFGFEVDLVVREEWQLVFDDFSFNPTTLQVKGWKGTYAPPTHDFVRDRTGDFKLHKYETNGLKWGLLEFLEAPDDISSWVFVATLFTGDGESYYAPSGRWFCNDEFVGYVD